MPLRDRAGFWTASTLRGLRWANASLGWVGSGLLLLGLTGVTAVFVWRDWPTWALALVLSVLAFVTFAEGSYRESRALIEETRASSDHDLAKAHGESTEWRARAQAGGIRLLGTRFNINHGVGIQQFGQTGPIVDQPLPMAPEPPTEP